MPLAVDQAQGLDTMRIGTGSDGLTYYRGGEQGCPLVLVNALGQDLLPWQRFVATLLPRRVITWELRGLVPPAARRPFAGHVDDLARVLRAEAVTSCHLVAWCTGPKTALRFSQRYPGMVRSMVFLNASFKHTGRAPEQDTAYEQNLEVLCRAVNRRPENASRLREMFQPGTVTASGANTAVQDNAVRRAFGSADALVAYAQQHLEFWAEDFTWEATAEVPVLFVSGERDEIVSTEATRAAAKMFPGAAHVVLPAVGHFALVDQAERVAGLVEGFTLAAER
ncbi:alpha/beta hydrolase [Micromonospora sp. RHAY321]|uniref:alpha/beta fold hydrolase n=1 Tax=Micromonospora sp. RHAY321 TaxID=2944807 RepID=UPI00207CCD37|nr:alpha/beta hydrolase [Micromonospora sp. RHAY321]MCO1593992.1 alpha/beta hydrolase [Micromonospora sp. RHAY321]